MPHVRHVLLTNNITAFWRCRRRCRFLNSLLSKGREGGGGGGFKGTTISVEKSQSVSNVLIRIVDQYYWKPYSLQSLGGLPSLHKHLMITTMTMLRLPTLLHDKARTNLI